MASQVTPFTTVITSLTVRDTAGAVVTNLVTFLLTVTFPDGTTVTPVVSNVGGGVYSATYDTKDVGETREDWSLAGPSGVPRATVRYYYYVSR